MRVYYFPTPNGRKVTIALEEMGLAYEIVPVNILRGEQEQPEFLRISPNGRIPALVDWTVDGAQIKLFESGAILQYLGRKTGLLYPMVEAARCLVDAWLFWQMAGLGPMAGQNHHFANYAPEKIPYAIDRYVKETNRLYGVLDRRLADRPYLAGDYSIADMACYPWIVPYKAQGQNLEDFPHVKRWLEAIASRPATERAYAIAKDLNPQAPQPVRRAEREAAKLAS